MPEPPFVQAGQANVACLPALVHAHFYCFFSSFSYPLQAFEHIDNMNSHRTTRREVAITLSFFFLLSDAAPAPFHLQDQETGM